MTNRHQIPTHLNVEDRAIFGLTVRQVGYLVVGCAGAYNLWTQWPDWPDAARLGAASSVGRAAEVKGRLDDSPVDRGAGWLVGRGDRGTR